MGDSRRYLPTASQLIDRLCIVTLKSIKIAEHKQEYEQEAGEIMHDLDLILGAGKGELIRTVQVNAICNETIWANESRARQGLADQDQYLRFTHSVNGVRTAARNKISNLLIKKVVKYKGDVIWSDQRPQGQMKRVFNIDKIKATGWKARVSLEQGIERTVNWYLENK